MARRLSTAWIVAALAISAVVAAYMLGPTMRGSGGAIPPPRTGAFFGAWVSSNTGYTVDEREAQIGRKYRIVHRYHGWDEQIPTAQEVMWANGGRILYLSWDAEIFGSSSHPTWRQIAAGSQDSIIDAQAARIKAFRRPLFMDFSQEPELRIEEGGYGSAADYAAAFRHIVERFQVNGVTNVSWVWSVTGASEYRRTYVRGLYPDDDVVDWIGWDPYNSYICRNQPWTSFADKIDSFYNWLVAYGHANKPFMLSEYGSLESDVDPLAKGRWFKEARVAMKSGMFPNLKALVYFDSRTRACDWRIDTSRASLDGFRILGSDPYLNPGG